MSQIIDNATDFLSSVTKTGLMEYLQCDSRPTFIIDTRIEHDERAYKSRLAFSNTALQNHDTLFDLIKRLINDPSFPVNANIGDETATFLSWLQLSSTRESMYFNGLLWSSTILHQRWVIVSGCYQPISDRGDVCDEGRSLNSQTSVSITRTLKRQFTSRQTWFHNGPNPCTASLPKLLSGTPIVLAQVFGVRPSSHNLTVLGYDWASTTTGPIESWPPVLRQMVPYLLNGLQPGIILWGPERIMIYNEPYVSLIKALHPGALGTSAKTVFGNFWDDEMEPQWHAVEVNGAARHENTQLYMDRSGFLEETYFTYSLTPLLDAQGHCCGVDNRCFESTRQVVVEERMLSLLKISESIASVTSLDNFWQGLVGAMASNPSNFSVFALYSLPDSDLVPDIDGDEPSVQVDQRPWVLRGSNGFTPGHRAIPEVLRTDSATGFAPAFRAVLDCSSPLVVNEGDGLLQANVLRGFDTPALKLKCYQVVVCPLRSSTRDTMGFLVLGINPSRPYDDEYKTFVRLLARQIETSISPILLLVNEKMRSRMNAQKSEYEQRLLTLQLEEQKFEAQRSESRFLKFAEQAPLGVFILDADGGVKFANEAWYKLAGIIPAEGGTHEWLGSLHPDDKECVDEQWQRLIDGYTQTNFEWRTVRRSPGKSDEVMYLRSSCFPELSADGKMVSVTGVLEDLSLERAQQRAQGERLKDALEAKQEQEYFMDMVSHEIRNPLHAVLQLAEETSSLLEETKPATEKADYPFKIRDCIENLHTIMYCGHHQKQILDDVLTLSKLNSNMLTLSLTEVSPISIVSKALKFFDSDIRLFNIDISLSLVGIASDSQDLNVLMDSGRVLQILVNLVGNSIKFMKDGTTRKLSLTVEMRSNKPVAKRLRYLPSGKKYADPTAEDSSDTKKVVYIHYSVKDTGPGLSSPEMDLLFERFKQVSPKTHTQYGGSGLGLFISRELAERHGGEIGLASVVNQGSTFAFYVKCLTAEQEITETGLSSDVKTMSSTNETMKPTSPIKPQFSSMPKLDTLSSKNNTAVLIVEDNIVNQKILDRQLKRFGYQTQTANHGAEALSVLKKSTWWHDPAPDSSSLSIILCDLEMPVMDGLTCVKQIREWQRNKLLFPNVPVVALTGNARNEQISAAKAAGFDDVLSKPYSMQSLISMIDSMIHKQ